MLFRSVQLSYIVILHQTTTGSHRRLSQRGCHISLFYIKPQPLGAVSTAVDVVIYRYSTSNHNRRLWFTPSTSVVIYRYSTSNHNFTRFSIIVASLSYIVILHQTTTTGCYCHQTTRCHISLFYIKPQLAEARQKAELVVIYRYSTSNHNNRDNIYIDI